MKITNIDILIGNIIMGLKSVVLFLSICILSIALTDGVYAQDSSNWYMAGANPQRTSWIPEEINPQDYNSYGVIWYRPIEAYIDQKVQIVTGYGNLYLSTSKGLYALDASTGEEVWRFDSELPLGHSPTVINNTVYVGSYDHKVYAFDAETGSIKWISQEALAGFSTNPLVINGRVYLGNRDGYFYAFNESSGSLEWRYPSENQPLGPILYSATYNNGQIFFASNDNYAYALDAESGNQIWKSEKLPGDGYHSWWPVVYKDKIILSAASAYRHATSPGVLNAESNGQSTGSLDNYAILGDTTGYVGDRFVAGDTDDPVKNWSWEDGTTIMDNSKVTEYYEDDGIIDFDRLTNKPWRRTVIILNQSDGMEYTYDFDGDGFGSYAPFTWLGTRSGNRYPPIIMPDKDGNPNQIVYTHSLYRKMNNVVQSSPMGWVLGSKYMAVSSLLTAHDEPQSLSGAGRVLFSNICCDRLATWNDLSNPSASTNNFWDYTLTLESNPTYPERSRAPNYDEMWWGSSMFGSHPRLWGNYGNINGLYHNHGDQNPLVPYQDKFFIHRSNAIIALGPNPSGEPVSRKLETLNSDKTIENTVHQLTKDNILSLLEREIEKMIQAGHLRAGYYNNGQFRFGYPHLLDYFDNPGETLYALIRSYPHLNPELQNEVEQYLREEYDMYFKNRFTSSISWSDGAAREAFDLPEEVKASLDKYTPTNWAHFEWSWDYPQHNFYYISLFLEEFITDSNEINTIYDRAKRKLMLPAASDIRLYEHPYEHNAFIAGYIGFLKLQELAGKEEDDSNLRVQVQEELQRLIDLRIENFSKDNPWTNSVSHARTLNISRNFMYLVPELSQQLRNNLRNEVQEAIDEYQLVAPFWFVSKYEATQNEGVMHNLYDYNALFTAKAHILQEPYHELSKYIDAPAFKVGDLFYIQNLVTALEAPDSLSADFSTDTLTGLAPLSVSFTDQSSGNPSSWMWDFDNDGTVDSTQQNPIHQYAQRGIYSVSLTVSNGTDESTELKTDYISVLHKRTDCNKDDAIDTLDIQFSLMYYGQIDPSIGSDFQSPDIDEDGIVTTLDIAHILKDMI